MKDLHKQWDAKNAEHKEARGFIYRVWPTLDTSRLEDSISKAQKALKTCEDAGDRISILKLLKGTEGHADRLAKELKELHPDLQIDDVEPARKLQKVSAEVIKLGTDIQDYLKIARARQMRIGIRSEARRRRGLGALRRRRTGASDADGRLAQQAQHHVIAIVLLDEHELATTRIGTLNGENAGHIGRHKKSSANQTEPRPSKPEA